ncbi:GNAT family N-acetyltransferase [Formicincola oecophyllae]|uniref:GNAT family N-acetyltransferase n=1 Tax=Formicincola oecophyllae TaxID=2558361 RepID=A0A4Y6U8Z6_9PROT|nr:GNAT family N-acetyltransferase [Formicincola oecophyllae]QDH13943.1 GNAT family N-acetyltransferase [Formicincola oecophyllae]
MNAHNPTTPPAGLVYQAHLDPSAILALRWQMLGAPGTTPAACRLADDGAGAHHGLLTPEGLVVCCLSVFNRPQGLVQIRKVATHPAWQRRGLGAWLMGQAMAEAAGQGRLGVWLNARAGAEGFYQKLGFHQAGEPYLEGGVGFVRMARALQRPA